MKKSKILIPLVVTTVLGYLGIKWQNSRKVVSDIAKGTADATIHKEKSFGGLSLSVINTIIENTPRAVKAVIDGDTLEYFYSSNSGKHVYSSKMSFDSEGKLNYTDSPFPGGTAPSIFVSNLLNARKENKENLGDRH
ncbi:hypothetical protein RZN22_01730 [Bacillaceae bacterium S4-13-58]